MFRRVVIPATKGVPSRGFRWMPDKEYRAKDWFYIIWSGVLGGSLLRTVGRPARRWVCVHCPGSQVGKSDQ